MRLVLWPDSVPSHEFAKYIWKLRKSAPPMLVIATEGRKLLVAGSVAPRAPADSQRLRCFGMTRM